MYRAGCYVAWALLFVGFWIYAIAEYGFLVGVGLGWLPSAIAASILSIFWPLAFIVPLLLYVLGQM